MNRQVKPEGGKTVLFVCIENAGRSQMAEPFFRKYAPAGYMDVSSGTRPVGEINPVALTSTNKSKILTDDKISNAAVIVNMDV